MQRATFRWTSAGFRLMLAAGFLTVAAVATWAFINPNFTPIHLLEQSDLVVVVKFEGEAKDGKMQAKVEKVLKGKAPAKPLTFDFFAGAFEAQGKEVVRMIGAGSREGLFFVGFFEDEAGGGGMGGDEEVGRGMLHIGGKWIALSSVEEGLWDMEKIDSRMLGTWAGSTDMLLRAVNYILGTEGADVPIKSNVEWATESKFADVKGKINFLEVVDLEGDGKLTLHVGCDAGDRLFRCEGGRLTDVTAKHNLNAKSKFAVWADFDGDGKLDLASSDGRTLNRPLKVDGEIVALGVVSDAGGSARLVACTAKGPVVDGGAQPAGADEPVEKMFIADFDGDALADILTLGPGGGFLYRGTAPGVFAAAVRTQIGLGKGKSVAQLGDYDADGLMDIFVSAEDRNRIWHNLGKGTFVEMLDQSGEIAYISKSGGSGGMTGDVNNDGRQDILVAYDGMSPQIFFNRGFRSFGHARMIDLADLKLLPEAGNGQQAACLADLNGDGAQDMVLALKNGELWVFPRKVLGDRALAVTVALARGKKVPQPVIVKAHYAGRELGSWNLTEGGAPAFFGVQEAGPVKVEWQFPGGKPETKTVRVIDKSVRVVLTP
ncbi:MAG TPA: VCBS repeat-containing protein [Planctomycetota bacterium]|nr:VCBS repeat-containing protein [Planctomycetota bacterium]